MSSKAKTQWWRWRWLKLRFNFLGIHATVFLALNIDGLQRFSAPSPSLCYTSLSILRETLRRAVYDDPTDTDHCGRGQPHYLCISTRLWLVSGQHLRRDRFTILTHKHCTGFLHTAYLLKAEGRLEQSSHFNDHIPRGELVELLTKALLYTEVETHCKGDGLITDCQTPFSLLKRHECTIDPLDNGVSVSGKKNTAFPSPSPAVPNGIETPQKRKADAPADGDLREKRSRRSEETEDALGLNGRTWLHTFRFMCCILTP